MNPLPVFLVPTLALSRLIAPVFRINPASRVQKAWLYSGYEARSSTGPSHHLFPTAVTSIFPLYR